MNEYFDFWKLLAGLGLFLFGMRILEEALKVLAGRSFRRFLRQSTNKPVHSVMGGVVATTIVQSSSLVGLIVLAFVGAGIIPLVNAIGIVLGSNLGTTFTGWIVATLGFKLNLTAAIYPLIALGGLGYGLFKGKWKSVSQLVLGLALLLMGLDLMKDSVHKLTEQVDMNILRDYPLFAYLLIGVVFTAIIQSSSAAMMLTLSALYAGIIPLPAAAALVIGADLGTTSTVLLGSLQGAVSKRRLAMAHILFNVSVDALAFMALLPLLALIKKLQIEDPLYALVAFHSFFNLFGLILFIPFIKQYSHFLERWIKEDKQHIQRYIHNVPVNISEAALEAVAQETRHLLYLVARLNLRFLRINTRSLSENAEGGERSESTLSLPKDLKSANKLEHYIAIKKLEGEIVSYALKIQIEDTNESLNTDKIEQLTHRVDSLLKAVRSAVYSAKSLKDIDADLESFHADDNDKLTQYFELLKTSAQSVYDPVLGLICNPYENELIEEELVSLKQQSIEFHQDYASKIYKKMNKIHLTSLDLSTLLNVNKEMHTSEKALIEALEQL